MVEVQRQHCSIQPEALKVSLGRAVSDDPPSLISNARGMLSPHFAEAAGLAQSQVPSVPGNIQVPLGSSCWGVKEEKKTNPSINREYNPGRWRSHAGVHTRPGYISAPPTSPRNTCSHNTFPTNSNHIIHTWTHSVYGGGLISCGRQSPLPSGGGRNV